MVAVLDGSAGLHGLEFGAVQFAAYSIPIVSIVVPFFGLTISTLRILKGNPQK